MAGESDLSTAASLLQLTLSQDKLLQVGDVDPEVADSARSHGVVDEDILHAYDHVIRVHDLDEGFVMLIGPDRAANLLEIGVVNGPRIVHAMPAREKFLR